MNINNPLNLNISNAFNDSEGNPSDVSLTDNNDGTSPYASRRDHTHKLDIDASKVDFTPAGSITSTNTQNAVEEVDSDVSDINATLGSNPEHTNTDVAERLKGFKSTSDSDTDVLYTYEDRVGIGIDTPATKLNILQFADNNGLRINGYDDKSSEYGEFYVDAFGYFNITTSGTRSLVLKVPNGAAIFFKQQNTEIARLQSSQFKMPDDSAFGLGNSGGTPDYSFGYCSADDVLQFIKGKTLGSDVIMSMDNTKNVGINTVTPTTKLDINSDKIRLRTAKTPSSASDTGNEGDICWDNDYIYVCVATNTWKRVALSTW